MYYVEHYRTRWHDTDANRHVRPSQILVYMQETANLHMISAGQSLDELRDTENLAFILMRLSVEWYRHVNAYEEIAVRTWVSPGKGCNYPRYFSVEQPDGTPIAKACSHWVILDLSTRLPCRADAYRYNYEPEPPLSLTPPRRFALPDSMTCVGERRIAYSDLDYNYHMNNTRYPDMVCDFLPADVPAKIRAMHFHYVKESAAGACLRVMRGERIADDGSTVYRFQTFNEQEELCLDCEVQTFPRA